MSTQQAADLYYRHPPGAALFADGAAADSGTLTLLDSNISRLVLLGTRQLVEAVVGPVAGVAAAADVWNGLADVAGGTAGQWDPGSGAIPWDRRTAARFGPVPLIADRDLSDGRVTIRLVSLAAEFDIHAGATASQTAYFALTLSGDPAALAAGSYVAYDAVALGGTGLRTAVSTLTGPAPIGAGPRAPWPSRAAGAQQTFVIPGWIWFGWRLVGTTSDSTVISLSAFEAR